MFICVRGRVGVDCDHLAVKTEGFINLYKGGQCLSALIHWRRRYV